MEIKYKIKFLSDWHIGSGSGIPGVIDNGVLKDKNNIPIITGKTIKGLVRDSLEDLLALKKDIDKNIIGDIFGKEGRETGNAIFYNPKLFVEEDLSLMDDSNYKYFIENYNKRDNLRNVRTHTAIDNIKGIAKETSLFSEEVSDSSFEFFGKIEAEDSSAKFIVSALRFITKIGGKRRRGLGYCNIEILEIEKYENYIEEFINGSI